MKKFLFPVLLLIPFWVKAQVYHPLVDSGAVWNEEDCHCESFMNSLSCECYGDKYFIGGDTIIDSLVYKNILYESTYHYFAEGNYLSGSNIEADAITIAAIREDSDKKVWIRFYQNSVFGYCGDYFPPIDSELLFYDFNIVPGDTLILPVNEYLVANSDSVQLNNGEWRKRYYLTGYHNCYWIEGIGSLNGLFDPFENPFECLTSLTCYSKNEDLLMDNILGNSLYVSCDVINGVSQPNNSAFDFEISPNPASDLVTINFSFPYFSSAQIKITDVLGRNLFTDEIKSNQPLQIATEKFSGNTMLFCELWQEGKLIGVKKVIIHQ